MANFQFHALKLKFLKTKLLAADQDRMLPILAGQSLFLVQTGKGCGGCVSGNPLAQGHDPDMAGCHAKSQEPSGAASGGNLASGL